MAEPIQLPAVDAELAPEGSTGNPTPEEIAWGNHLGAVIDRDDDTDTGARETYR